MAAEHQNYMIRNRITPIQEVRDSGNEKKDRSTSTTPRCESRPHSGIRKQIVLSDPRMRPKSPSHSRRSHAEHFFFPGAESASIVDSSQPLSRASFAKGNPTPIPRAPRMDAKWANTKSRYMEDA